MNQAIKQMLIAVSLIVESSSLFGQARSKEKEVLPPWPSTSSPRAIWERVETNSPNQKKATPHLTQFVDQSSSYFQGVFRGKKFTLHYQIRVPGAYGSGTLILSIGGKEQTFTSITPEWGLTGAGDTDKDGKLDLVIAYPGQGGGTNAYLVAPAKP